MQRLSTGSRINSAMDDAAGSAISLHLSNRISGSDIAQNNIQMASSMLNVALGALDNISNMFLRLRDLSLQAMNDTYSDEERKVLQDEAESLVNEIYRVKSSTKFNSKQILGVDTNTITIESEAVAQGYTVVKTAQQLKDALKTNDANCKVMLFADINLDDLGVDETGSNWTAVGTTTSRFKGTFDGNGFSISNLKINRPDQDYQGLFGATNGSTIKNISLDGGEITGKNFTGGIAGLNSYNSTIENCSSSAAVTGSGNYTGGLVGDNYSAIIKNSSSSATVTGNSNDTGGLVGLNSTNSVIENCSSSATVTGSGNYTGGLVGFNNADSIINNCSSSANVTGNGSNTGGLAGYNSNSIISNCNSSGNVTGNGNYTGGLVGYNYNNSTIENCYSSADVTGKNYTGGIVGINYTNATINNCSSFGIVTGNNERTGGIVGTNHDSTITNCLSSADVIGNGNYAGGITGTNYGNSIVDNCASSGNVSGKNETGGLAGRNSVDSVIKDSSTTSKVSGTTGTGAFIGNYIGGELSGNEYNSTINEGMKAVGGGLNNPSEEQIKDNQELIIETNSSDIGAHLDLKKIGANIDNIVNTGNSGSSTNTKATIQVGYDAGVDNTIDVDTGFYLGKFNINISTEFGAKKALDRIDEVMTKILDKKSELGAKLNRLDNAMYNQKVSKTDLMSQNSLIKDTDVAKESCNLVQHQILQEISTSLFTVNRQSPNIALKLLNLA